MELVWESAAGELEVVSFDATLREEHTGSATVTAYPLEGGADAADHVVPSVAKAMFDCFVSDSPSDVPLSHMYGVRGSVQSVDLDAGTTRELVRGASKSTAAEYEKKAIKATASVLTFDGPFARRERVYEQLEGLRKAKTLLSASTILRSLENVVITNLGARLESKDGDGITFSLELTALEFAETQIVAVPEPTEPRGRPSTDAGATTTSEAGAGLVSNLSSLTGFGTRAGG